MRRLGLGTEGGKWGIRRIQRTWLRRSRPAPRNQGHGMAMAGASPRPPDPRGAGLFHIPPGIGEMPVDPAGTPPDLDLFLPRSVVQQPTRSAQIPARSGQRLAISALFTSRSSDFAVSQVPLSASLLRALLHQLFPWQTCSRLLEREELVLDLVPELVPELL